MNQQKILQNYDSKGWSTIGIIKQAEEGIKPGIYNIHLAKKADINSEKPYDGKILYVDKAKDVVYQQLNNRDFITHKLESFKTPPPVGKDVSIQYDKKELNFSQISSLSKNRNIRI